MKVESKREEDENVKLYEINIKIKIQIPFFFF